MQNELFDLIVIGASFAGISLANTAKKRNNNLNILIISRTFNPNIKIEAGIKTVTGVISFSSYIKGIIGVYTGQNLQFFAKNVVIATGDRPQKLNIKSNTFYYKLSDLITKSTVVPIVLIGNNTETARAACELSKRHKYIYICSATSELDCSNELKEKIEGSSNINVLPLCNIVSCKNDKDGNLKEIKLDTFDSIKCGFAIAFTQRTPEFPRFAANMLALDENGAIIVDNNQRTTLVPNIYAIGACASNKKKNVNKVLKNII